MGANDDFKRLAKEMAEKARAQREKAAKAARTGETTENGTAQDEAAERPEDLRPRSDRK